jgi:hypothetical protein
VVRFELFKVVGELVSRAHCGDFDFRYTPSREIADILHALFLEVEKADDDLLAGIEGGNEAIEELPHCLEAFGLLGGFACEGFFDQLRLGFAEVGEAHKGSRFVASEPVVARIDRDAGDPVGERAAGIVLIELKKDLGECFLCQVIVVRGGADLVSDDAVNLRRQEVDKFTPSGFVSLPDIFEEVQGNAGIVTHQGLLKFRALEEFVPVLFELFVVIVAEGFEEKLLGGLFSAADSGDEGLVFDETFFIADHEVGEGEDIA